ncbi:MAG: ABC transporter permease [Eubacteriales bacterium]|nr:ABC transporter permease [Eubacteriales bacterium]
MINFIQRAIIQGIPLLFGASGEILTEKSGNLNLGIPGIMYMGGISGVIGAFFYQNAVTDANGVIHTSAFPSIFIPLLCALIGAGLTSLIYCFLTVTLRANQNVTGLAITTFGVGFGNFFGGSLAKLSGSDITFISLGEVSKYFKATLPFAEKLGGFGQLVFSYTFLAYAAIIIAVVMTFVLKKTRLGLHLRAVGENPATADAAGINVTAYKYGATCIGGMVAGLGGLYYVMDYMSGIWSNNGFGDRGWLAIAIVIFALWNPDFSILGSILFGGLYILYIFIPDLSRGSQELFKMLPYVVTIAVLVITSVRKKRENQPPASLGLSYFREDR